MLSVSFENHSPTGQCVDLKSESSDMTDVIAETDFNVLMAEYNQALEDLKQTMILEQAQPNDNAFAVVAATMKFAGTIGGKLFILGSVRLILSITLVFFDVVIFLILYVIVKINPVVRCKLSVQLSSPLSLSPLESIPWCVATSEIFLAEISLRSPGKLFICIIFKKKLE